MRRWTIKRIKRKVPNTELNWRHKEPHYGLQTVQKLENAQELLYQRYRKPQNCTSIHRQTGWRPDHQSVGLQGPVRSRDHYDKV